MLRRTSDERGAVLPIVAVSLTFIVAIAAFAVDLGMQRVVRRDMQAVADIVAIDVVRTLHARSASVVLNDSTFRSAVKDSVDRNVVSTLGDPPRVVVEVGVVQPSGTFSSAGSLSYTASSAATSGPTVSQASLAVTAVRVTSAGSVAFAFVSGHGDASRWAVATSDSTACFAVGSYAARVATGDSYILGPLTQILGTDANLTLLDLQGLADVSVTALDLLGTDLTAGGFTELLSTSVRLTDLYLAMASVLPSNASTAASIAVLDRLGHLSLPALNVTLGQVLDLGTGSQSALTAALNVLDVVTAAAMVANQDHAITLPEATVSVPGVSHLTATAVVAQKPVVVCGRAGQTHATSSQVVVTVSGSLLDVNLGLATISAPLKVAVSVDPASVDLTGLACAGSTRTLAFQGASGLLDTKVVVGKTTDADALSVQALGSTVANGYVTLLGSRPAGSTEIGSIAVVDENYAAATPFTLGDDSVGLPQLTTDAHIQALPGSVIGTIVNVTLGGLINGVVEPLVDIVVNPVLQVVDTAVLDPLLRALGINLTGADVRARPKADCGYPKLAG